MIFNDFVFLFAFLPVVLALVYGVLPRAWRTWTLVLASLFFSRIAQMDY